MRSEEDIDRGRLSTRLSIVISVSSGKIETDTETHSGLCNYASEFMVASKVTKSCFYLTKSTCGVAFSWERAEARSMEPSKRSPNRGTLLVSELDSPRAHTQGFGAIWTGVTLRDRLMTDLEGRCYFARPPPVSNLEFFTWCRLNATHSRRIRRRNCKTPESAGTWAYYEFGPCQTLVVCRYSF